MEKECRSCKKILCIDKFGKNSAYKSGINPKCRECHNNYIRLRRLADHERSKAIEKERYYTEYYTQKRQQFRKNNREKLAEREKLTKRMYKFNLNKEAWDELKLRFNNRCAICHQSETAKINGVVKELSIDHDHSCCPGKTSCGRCIRGLLCQKCNSAIGYLNDDIELLNNAIEYLLSHSKEGAR
jgi:hypothetical protein